MSIRDTCREWGFKISGKLTRMSDPGPDADPAFRIYLDEAGNEYFLRRRDGALVIVTADGGVL